MTEYEFLRRKEDFLAEGVHTIFGVKNGEAEIQALCFEGSQFTAEQARQWLQDWQFQPLDFVEGSLGQ